MDPVVRRIRMEQRLKNDNLRLLLERSDGLGITERMLMAGPCLDTWTRLFQNLAVCKISPTILENQRDLGSVEFLLNLVQPSSVTSKSLSWVEHPTLNTILRYGLILDIIVSYPRFCGWSSESTESIGISEPIRGK